MTTMTKEKQLLLAFACGVQPDHELVQKAANNNALSQSFLDKSAFKKSDLFSPTDSGVAFFDTPDIWPNLPNVLEHLIKNGAEINASDFLVQLNGRLTILELAEKHDTLNHLFDPKIWKNNLHEMEKLWFETQFSKRKNLSFNDYYCAVAELSGQSVREVTLKKMDLTPKKVNAYLANGQAKELDALLREKGDYLRKADIFLIDDEGQTAAAIGKFWEHADETLALLNKNGERLDYNDFFVARGNSKSLFEYGREHNSLNPLFNADMWLGRTEQMMRIWESLPDRNKNEINITRLVVDLEDSNYGHLVDLDNLPADFDLSAPHHPALSSPFQPDSPYIIRPLGLQKTWNNIWAIAPEAENGLPDVTLDDLRQTHGWFNNTCLHAAIQHGFYEVVVEMLNANDEWFNAQDLTDAPAGQQSILDILVEQGKVDLLMQPENWSGSKKRMDEMILVWNALPNSQKNKYDMNDILSTMNRINLRKAVKTREIKGKGGLTYFP